ncbi:hypothetical protein NDU88_004784 [Pleurodeles waltl]|uniref:Uncharacterized protein n=1 Tax=Pleurodeles waltl TaxID=8319 RepID=A0AAV7L0F1_PLEWA|nr:hypothetical protein NDU88_004784 [Pleurodeles waltl]
MKSCVRSRPDDVKVKSSWNSENAEKIPDGPALTSYVPRFNQEPALCRAPVDGMAVFCINEMCTELSGDTGASDIAPMFIDA